MLVLWIIALLTIIAIAMTAAQRTETALAGNQLDGARFRAEAEAAIAYAALELMAPPVVDLQEEVDPWAPTGEPRTWMFAGDTLEIRILNEASLIDLNHASRELLIGLLSAAGVPESDQESLVDAILDWRDTDDLHLANGAEDADYEAAGLSYGAKDGPFDSVEELRDVLGIGADLYRILAPVLTVDGARSVLQDLAPPLVLAALSGTTVEEVQARQLDPADPLAQPQAVVNRGGPLYRIRVTRAATAGGARPSMEALVNVAPRGPVPVSVLWRRYAQTPAESSGGQPE
jgi:general secretion pathway protein K